MAFHRIHIGRFGRAAGFLAWVLVALFFAGSCSPSGIPIEPAGPPNASQDNDSGGY